MIVDTMSFEEITKYLIKTSFSESNLYRVLTKHIGHNEKKYRREIISWKKNPLHRSKIRIFKPVISNYYDEELVWIPFGVKEWLGDYIVFLSFRYRGRKYVAMKLTNNNVIYYSWHTFERYSERYLHVLNPTIDYNFIANMLVYNSGYTPTHYSYKGRDSTMYVSTHGGFLCLEYSNYTLVKTFISCDDYFPNQAELDKPAFQALQRMKELVYGYSITRA